MHAQTIAVSLPTYPSMALEIAIRSRPPFSSKTHYTTRPSKHVLRRPTPPTVPILPAWLPYPPVALPYLIEDEGKVLLERADDQRAQGDRSRRLNRGINNKNNNNNKSIITITHTNNTNNKNNNNNNTLMSSLGEAKEPRMISSTLQWFVSTIARHARVSPLS